MVIGWYNLYGALCCRWFILPASLIHALVASFFTAISNVDTFMHRIVWYYVLIHVAYIWYTLCYCVLHFVLHLVHMMILCVLYIVLHLVHMMLLCTTCISSCCTTCCNLNP